MPPEDLMLFIYIKVLGAARRDTFCALYSKKLSIFRSENTSEAYYLLLYATCAKDQHWVAAWLDFLNVAWTSCVKQI